MFRLPILTDEGAMGLALFEKERGNVQLLSTVLRLSNKSSYTSCARCWCFRFSILLVCHPVVFSFLVLP